MNPVAQLHTVEQQDGTTYQSLCFWCPGCEFPGDDGVMQGGAHMLPVNTTVASPQWEFDGNLEAPTLSPSILTRGGRLGPDGVCHSFMRAGQMEFLSDCTHQYAGQTVPLPPLPDWLVKESS